jgi:rubrerythrin
MNIEDYEETLLASKEERSSTGLFTVLKEEYVIGPCWKCSECGYEARYFITVVHSSVYYGDDYDMECPQCGGNQIDEV